MSLYHHNFTFLPIPPRSRFSHGGEATRFMLPDCATVDELQIHITRLIVVQVTIPGFWVQILLGASVVCVLVILIALIIARRMYEQSFWLVRVMRRPTGIVIVPNTLLAFTLFEGFFAILYIAFCWLLRSWFQVHSCLPYRYVLWMLLVWFPLFCGPFAAVLGTYFAIPMSSPATGLDEDGEEGRPRAAWHKRFAAHSLLFNTSAVILPLVVFVSIATPACIANTHYLRSLQRLEAWIALYDGQTAFTEEMVHEAQRVWFDLGRAFYIAANVYALWAAYAFLLAAAYIWVTVRLLRAVGAELSKSDKGDKELTMMATQFVVSEGQSLSMLSRQEDDEVLRGIEVELWAARRAHQTDSKGGGGGGSVSGIGSMMSQTSFLSATDDALRRARTPKYFARLRKLIPNIVAQTASHPHLRNVPPSHDHQTRAMRKAYRHHFTQFIAIAPGCLAFATIAMWRSLTVCSSTEQPKAGGGSLAQITSAQNELAVTWAVVVLGSVTLMAITKRTYEPVLSQRKWTPCTVKAGRKFSGGITALEPVHSFILPSASQALAERLGEGSMSYETAPTHADSIRRLERIESRSSDLMPLRNMSMTATML